MPDPNLRATQSGMVLHYQDDGPSGPCGQAVSVTAPWDRLYRYEREEDAVAYMRFLMERPPKHAGRRNPRIVGWWYEENVHDGPIVPEVERA